jgi:hypothetical protein
MSRDHPILTTRPIASPKVPKCPLSLNVPLNDVGRDPDEPRRSDERMSMPHDFVPRFSLCHLANHAIPVAQYLPQHPAELPHCLLPGWLLPERPMVKQRASTSGRIVRPSRCRRY